MKSFYSSSDLEAGCAPPHNFMEAAGVGSPELKARFFCGGLDDDDEPHHFLDSCNLCRKPLPRNHDIFMYRGDMAFCSEGCRQEKIEMDEGKDKNRKLSLKASSRKDSNKGGSATSPPKSNKVHVRTGTVVAAG